MVQVSPITFHSTLKTFAGRADSSREIVFLPCTVPDDDNSSVPKRMRNENDKRPDCSEDFWNWINGNYKNIKKGSLETNDYNIVSFIAYDDTEDGMEEMHYKIIKRSNGTTEVICDRLGRGEEVKTTKVDNLSGKVISEQFRDKTTVYPVRMYYEDGTVKKEQSLLQKIGNYINIPNVKY